MKKITMMILSAAALLTTACSSSDEMQQQTAQTENGWSEYITVEAGTPGGADISTNGSRRVAVDTSNPLKSQWEDGDQLTVWAGDGCSTDNMSKSGFTLISGAGTGTGKFSGKLWSSTPPTSTTPLIAIIDKENDAIDASVGSNVTTDLHEQVGATADKALDYELFYATSINSERNFKFTHKMALIKWTIKVDDVSSGDQCDIVLSGTGLKNSATLDPATGTLTPGTDDGTITLTNVSLNAGTGNTELYVVVPPCTVSSKITAKLTMTSGSKQGQLAIGALGAFTSFTFVGNNYYTAGPNEFTLRDDVVDLGLPSGTLWAKMNVGASKPEEYGDYFAWGETEPYYSSQDPLTWKADKTTGYAWSSYFDTSDGGSTFVKYNLSNNEGTYKILQPAEDAATANWGSAWKMPTHAQWQELSSNCYWVWTTNYNGTGVKGMIVYKAKDEAHKGKRKYSTSGDDFTSSYSLADPHIFLPAAGYRYFKGLSLQSSYGSYWSSELLSDYSYGAWGLGFYDGSVGADGSSDRYYGLSVRPVLVQ